MYHSFDVLRFLNLFFENYVFLDPEWFVDPSAEKSSSSDDDDAPPKDSLTKGIQRNDCKNHQKTHQSEEKYITKRFSNYFC